MRFFELVGQSLRKFADFSGRASREEFWTFLAFVLIANLAAQSIGRLLGMGYAFGSLIGILLLLPQIAVAVRRLHDVGRSGRELIVPAALISLAPLLLAFRGILPRLVALGMLGLALLGFASLLLLLLKKGGTVPNRYGAAPKAFSYARQAA